MGYDLYAYVDVDQSKMEDLIKYHKLDKSRSDDQIKIAEKYEQECALPDLEGTGFSKWLFYHFNDACQIHELHYSVGTNFIRDYDEKFSNRRYHRVFEQQFGEKFPSVLINLNFSIKDDKNAKDAAWAIKKYFSEDEHLTNFAKWLEQTSTVCSIYELSY